MLRREDGHELRFTLTFEIIVQRRKGKIKRAWKRHILRNA